MVNDRDHYRIDHCDPDSVQQRQPELARDHDLEMLCVRPVFIRWRQLENITYPFEIDRCESEQDCAEPIRATLVA